MIGRKASFRADLCTHFGIQVVSVTHFQEVNNVVFKKLSFGSAFQSSRLRSAASRLAYVVVIASAAIGLYTLLTGAIGRDSVPVVNAQTDMYVSHRIDQLEQRFNYLESHISQLESQSRSTSIVPRPLPNSNEQEVQFLRTQIEGLRLRLGEVECGLLHVDERTLTAAQRTARRRAAQGSSERCRENASVPVELSARP